MRSLFVVFNRFTLLLLRFFLFLRMTFNCRRIFVQIADQNCILCHQLMLVVIFSLSLYFLNAIFIGKTMIRQDVSTFISRVFYRVSRKSTTDARQNKIKNEPSSNHVCFFFWQLIGYIRSVLYCALSCFSQKRQHNVFCTVTNVTKD